MRLDGARLVNAAHDVGGGLLAEAFHQRQLADVTAQFVDIGILADPAEVDEFGEGLLGNAVDVHAFLGNEARKLAQLLGWAVGVGAVQRLGATDVTNLDDSRSVTDGALIGNGERSDTLCDLDDLGDNLVGLDDTETSTRGSDAQTFALADVAQGGTFDRGALQLNRLEDGHWRYGAGGTRPLHLF